MNLTKKMKELYTGKYKMLIKKRKKKQKKKTDKGTEKWKDIPCSWITRINIV